MVATLFAAVFMLVGLTFSGCTVDSKEELAQSAAIRMAQAVDIAEATVPGLAVTAEITTKDGAAAYVVEVVDERGTEHVAYVNAVNGRTMEIDGDDYVIQEAPKAGPGLPQTQ